MPCSNHERSHQADGFPGEINNNKSERTVATVFDQSYKALRWILGLVFIYAGSVKLSDPGVFAVLIDAFGIVPESLLTPVSVALPALEVAAGVGILFDIRGSLSAIAGMLVLFIVILSYGIWMGLDVDCGCFGPEDPEAKAFHGLRLSLYRDMIMAAGIVFMFAWRRYRNIEPARITELIFNAANSRVCKSRVFVNSAGSQAGAWDPAESRTNRDVQRS